MLTPFRANGSIDWPALDELVEWYVAAGAAGLFAVCLSSEMFYLTERERLAIARRVVRRAGASVPVVATGTFGRGAGFVNRMAETGVAAVVCLTNYFAPEGASDLRWKKSLDRFLASADPSISLGLYECPRPFKWLLSPANYQWAIATGRFRFLKDTSCKMAALRSRIAAGQGTGIRLYNANTPTLLESLRAGADGYSGIGANYVPALYAWLGKYFSVEPTLAERLHRFLTVADPLIGARYPAAAKMFLGEAGLRIGPKCRQPQPLFSEEDLLMLQALRQEAAEWYRELGLAGP